MTSPLFISNNLAEKHPRAPSTDDRHDIVTVYDHAGAPHSLTNVNARELIRKSGWTRDAKEAAQRREAPLEPVLHINLEHGLAGVTSRHLQPRTSSPVINGVQQFEVTAPATTSTAASAA